MANLNPLGIKISNIEIQKFNGSDRMSIMPQFMELSIYQSMFESTIKAEMLINDQIGMFVNYPFTGEELIIVTYDQITNLASGIGPARTGKELKFIIKGVRDIVLGDRARSLMYIIDLASPQFLQNMRKYVSHAYHDLIEDMAEKIYDEYIADDTTKKYNILRKPFVKETSVKIRSIVVPNIRPFHSISWLAKHAVAKENDRHFLYLFYEDLQQYNFTTIQKIIENAIKVKEQLMQKKYKYISDIESLRKSSAGSGDPNQNLRVITNIVNNKRFSSLEKISGGYYQNELFEINMLQKAYASTATELDNSGKYDSNVPTLGPYTLNTPAYIRYVKNEKIEKEYSNRVRYIVNNFPDADGQGMDQPTYRRKFGGVTKYMYALNQIDLTITVPANMDLKVGQVIYCDIPEQHGFNIVQTDKYISGLFIISEIKQVLAQGSLAATTLRIYRDGYTTGLFETSLYNPSSTNDPTGGRR
jgi:hypothetical protein